MWYEKYKTVFSEGLNECIPDDFFERPCTEKEFEFRKKYTDKNYTDFKIPKILKLPNEYIELLKVSNGGRITNKERDFGFFDIESIREYYVNYGFIEHAPDMLPIALDGGGIFYAYKFNNQDDNPKIYGVHSSCIGFEEDTCFLGNTLEEVLDKNYDIADDIYDYQIANGTIKIHVRTKEEQESINLSNQLTELKEKKNTGEINLKYFLKTKREIEQKLKELK